MKNRKIALCALLTALAMILSYLESLVPLSFAVPGIKLGLANAAVIFALFSLNGKYAFLISLIRVFLVSVLFGSVMTLAYSFAGAVLSLAVMLLLKKTGAFGPVGISVAGAVSHNAGQILAAVFLLETGSLVFYLPVLLISGCIAGSLIGIVSGIIISRMKNIV